MIPFMTVRHRYLDWCHRVRCSFASHLRTMSMEIALAGFSTCGVCAQCTAAMAYATRQTYHFALPSAGIPSNQAPLIQRARGEIRSRVAQLDRTALHQLPLDESLAVRFDLFDDLTLTAIVSMLEHDAQDRFVCSGQLEKPYGGSDGTFVIVVDDDTLFATFWSMSHGTIEMRTAAGADNVFIRQVDASQLGGCINGTEHQIASPVVDVTDATDALALKLCEQNVDVLVVYTPAARNALGSDSAAHAFAQACIASANITFTNSEISPRVRLAGTALVSYVESSSLPIDLARMQSPFDGWLDEVPSLRQQYGADLVALIVESTANGCGVGYVMTQPSTSFAPFGYSVIQQTCALSNFSFAHELAHNYGCQHDHADPSPGAFSYSHGLRFVGQSGQQWRTLMAGSTGARIPYLSSPTVHFDGVPTGISEETPELGSPADNARSLFNTSHFVGGFADALPSDCNGNDFEDACDIFLGMSQDINGNSIPDECENLPCSTIELARMVPTNARSFDRFGSSISMSDDTIVAGAMMNDQFGADTGAAYVYDIQTPESPIVLGPADPAVFQWFGASVAIAPDGSHILVGAPRDGFEISDVGAVYIFRRVADEWIETNKIENPDPQQSEYFGWSVAWAGSNDGSLHAIVSSLFDDNTASNAGAVYIYPQTDTGWGMPTKLIAPTPASNDRFGYAVAGCSSGGHVIVGAPTLDHSALNTGAAFVYRHHDGAWILDATLAASDAAPEARFGWSVAIDGDRLIAGAPRDTQYGNRAGAAYIFNRTNLSGGGAWMQQIKLVAADAGPEKEFGSAVALRDDRAMVGAILDSTLGSIAGSVFMFTANGSSWQQQARIVPRDGLGYDNTGCAIAMAPSQPLAVLGACFDDHEGLVDVGTAMIVSTDFSFADCNGNGIADWCDIADGVSSDVNTNGVPDECDPSPCPADLTGDDARVGVPDLLFVINHWGPCDATCPLIDCRADLTSDCTVDAADLLEVIRTWGACPTES